MFRIPINSSSYLKGNEVQIEVYHYSYLECKKNYYKDLVEDHRCVVPYKSINKTEIDCIVSIIAESII